VNISDHLFGVDGIGVPIPFETADYSTGLASVMASYTSIHTGVDRGTVTVSPETSASLSPLDTPGNGPPSRPGTTSRKSVGWSRSRESGCAPTTSHYSWWATGTETS
jgi:hypothetical protein